MAWIFFQESEDLQLLYQIGSDQLPIVKSSDTLPQSYFQECQKVNCQLLQSGMMSQPLEEKTCQKSTSSAEDSHAKILALQEMEKAWQESEADYFSRLLDLRKKSNLHSFFSKTYQPSHQGEELKSLIKLPKWGMIVAGLVYPLRKLERTISVRDGGYWLTPNVMDSLPPRSKEALVRQFSTTRKGRTTPATLREQVLPECWPQNLFPTPTARDWRDNGKSPAELARNSTTLATQAGGQLNPQWVEWLMGYPTEWTGLKDWAMQWFRCKPEKRLRS